MTVHRERDRRRQMLELLDAEIEAALASGMRVPLRLQVDNAALDRYAERLGLTASHVAHLFAALVDNRYVRTASFSSTTHHFSAILVGLTDRGLVAIGHLPADDPATPLESLPGGRGGNELVPLRRG